MNERPPRDPFPGHNVGSTRRDWLLIAMIVAGMVLVLIAAVATAADGQRDLVNEHPVRTTPQYANGAVQDIQLGPADTIFLGGTRGFGQLAQVDRTHTLWHVNRDDVNGLAYTHQRLYCACGTSVVAYNPPQTRPVWSKNLGAQVGDVAWVRAGGAVRILAGGDFGGQLRLLGLDGHRISGYRFPAITGRHSTRSGPTGIARMAPNPTHDRVVAIGEFLQVAGKHREQAFSLHLGARQGTLQKWYVPDFNHDCAPNVTQFLRDVEFSHNGRFLVTVGKGAHADPGHLCDSAVKIAAGSRNSNAPYLQVRTCMDSLTGVGISPDDKSVIILGHMKCVEKTPMGTRDNAARFGLAMLNADTMRLRGFKSDKCRAVGGLAVEWEKAGAWGGYDCHFWGNSEARNPDPSPQFELARLAFLPRAG